MTIDVTYKGTHILTESDLCDLIDERDALAATLNICPDHYEDCEWDWRNCSAANPNVCTCGWQEKKGNPKAILAAHDAEKDRQITELAATLENERSGAHE